MRADFTGDEILGCVGAVRLVSVEGLFSGGVDGEHHSGLTVHGLRAVEPFRGCAVDGDRERWDGGGVGVF